MLTMKTEMVVAGCQKVRWAVLFLDGIWIDGRRSSGDNQENHFYAPMRARQLWKTAPSGYLKPETIRSKLWKVLA
jgi:hypothetical protein